MDERSGQPSPRGAAFSQSAGGAADARSAGGAAPVQPVGGAASARSADAAAAPGADEFFVGYLRTPRGQRAFLRGVALALLPLIGFTSGYLARGQRDPGDGAWDDSRARTFTGIVEAEPYPALRTIDPETGAATTLLLVEMGKFGGGRRAAPFDGKHVSVSGYLLARDGRRMIELEPGDGAIRPAGAAESAPAALRRAPRESLGLVTLRGEIVDTKCYLGAMKPGAGKPHKECATLCIRGGIPPTLITREPGGRARHYLLCGADGRALDERVLPFVADPVQVRGVLERRGDQLLLKIDPAEIRRL